MDIFDTKNLEPMLIAENQAAFDSPEFIYELKLDGIRCLVYLSENGVELQNKRSKRVTSIYPELKDIYKQVNKRCILDGEIFVLKEGKPDFFEMQKRSLMTSPVKIEFASKKLPVTFTAFDILYHEDNQLVNLPLMERKQILSDVMIEESPRFAVSRYIEEQGIALYNVAAEQELEGVVAKRKDSKYYFGKRTKDWIKMKALADEDFVVCGYYFNDDNRISIILGMYENGTLMYQSHVVMGISREDYNIMASYLKADKNAYPDFPDFSDATWLVPELVCRVQYMERTPGGGLRQPVFKGLRDDKYSKDCKLKV